MRISPLAWLARPRQRRRNQHRPHLTRSRRALGEALESRQLLTVSTAYVNDNWHTVTDNAPAGLSVGDIVNDANDVGGPTLNLEYGVEAFGTVTTGASAGSLAGSNTINDALAQTDVGGTTRILAGNYTELVNVTQSVNLVGANAGINPNTGSRVAESVFTGTASGIRIQGSANDITIDGLKFTGSSGATGGNERAAILLEGSAHGNVTIQNNFMDGILGHGVFQNFGTSFTNLNINDNRMVNTTVGSQHSAIKLQLPGGTGGGIRDNVIQYTTDSGIIVNQVRSFEILDNTIAHVPINGINLALGSQVLVRGNNISYANESNATTHGGIRVRDPDVIAQIEDNVVTNSFNGLAINGGTTATITVSNLQLTDNTTAIRIQTGGAATIGGGTTITGGTTGMLVDGAASQFVLGSGSPPLEFSGQSGDYIRLANMAMDNTVTDVSVVRFDGYRPSTDPINGAALVAIETKLWHEPDDANLGLLSLLDPMPILVSISDGAALEDSCKVVFTITLTEPSTSSVKVKYATSPGTASSVSDYKSTSGTITFAPGQTSKTITVSVCADTTVELDETFQVKLSGVTSADSTVYPGDVTATGTILNDDFGLITITDASCKENLGQLVFTVKLSRPVDVTTKVNFATSPGTATSGVDYTASAGTVTFSPGQTSKTITIKVTAESVFENDETFLVTLSNVQASGRAVSIADAEGTGTILNDDVGPKVTLSLTPSSIAENGGVTTVTAKLSSPSSLPVTVTLGFSGTATNGVDYTPSATFITIPIGQTTGSIQLTGINDWLLEDSETIVVDIVTVSGATEYNVQKVTATIKESLSSLAIVQIDPLSGGDALYVYGSPNSDNIEIKPSGQPDTYLVKLNATTYGPFGLSGSNGALLSRIYLYGGAGNDCLEVGASTTVDAFVDGGAGDDKILGGLGDDVLLGRAGRDHVTGRGGFDLLIGGLDIDTLIGEASAGVGSGENILIGGATSYDGDTGALHDLWLAWIGGGGFTTRTGNLFSGATPNGRLLNSSTVLKDGCVDQLYGGAGSDWFLDFETSSLKKDRTNKTSIDRLN